MFYHTIASRNALHLTKPQTPLKEREACCSQTIVPLRAPGKEKHE